ncbi:TetR/AcrR family transcriptional regulator [Streptomyces spongiae]|uniref:TetR/AcrR family transcriptional regulator n=1 Tax=Streptomyces spongiae TaxID=565072 RepID=A0A5N8XR72_9ACTN|nr:TetR/AcrR family transcriptional regulator [Streptomyces spongiae]MPY61666.1 TetR/AcrR family transcriptional regulator [Streptomyces spongiae]
MTVKSRREEYAALTRAAVLEAAAELFAEKGFDVTSVDDIAGTARVSKGAVYHHFADKRAIFDEVFKVSQQGVLDQVAVAIEGLGDSEQSPGAVASAAVRGFLGSYVVDARRRALLRQSAGVLGVQRCREVDNELALPLVLGLLNQLAERGELQPVPIEMTATVIFGTLCEAATALAFAEDHEQAGKEAAQVVGHMLSGLLKESS